MPYEATTKSGDVYQLHQAPFRVVVEGINDAEEIARITDNARRTYVQQGQLALDQLASEGYRGRFVESQWSEEERQDHESIKNVAYDHFTSKFNRLGISQDRLSEFHAYFTTLDPTSLERYRRRQSFMGGFSSYNGLTVVQSKVSFEPFTHAHELSHRSTGVVHAIRAVRRGIPRKEQLVENDTIGIPGVIEEGLANWDAFEILQEAVDTHSTPRQEDAIQNYLWWERNSMMNIQLMGINAVLSKKNRQSHELLELALVHKLAGLLGYTFTQRDATQLSNDELIQEGRDILERIRYSDDPDKEGTLRRLLKQVKTSKSIFDFLVNPYDYFFDVAQPHPNNLRFSTLFDPLLRAELTIQREFI